MTTIAVAGAANVTASLLFILSLAGLSKHETSRAGLRLGVVGMALALTATAFWSSTTRMPPSR